MNVIASHKQPPIFDMMPAIDKIIESILHLVTLANRDHLDLTQYDVVKSLFFADKSHLNKFGRPITFDNYVAMNHGPVPSCAYSILKGEFNLKMHNLDGLPWEKIDGEHPTSTTASFYKNPKREASDEILSESDMEALAGAFATVKSLTFGQIRRLTHDDPAYIAAWADGESQNAPMSYGMLFDVPDFEEAEHIQFASLHR